ncbi:MAG: hypothetical protein IMW98_08600 [Firmicutes bacterium]|nr:hypothetical protein [Bacillota bacterium]MBE3590865.1 hypothetical protein [Bacillota bacterium]
MSRSRSAPAEISRVRLFTAGDARDLERQINEWLAAHPCRQVRFLQLATDGEETYTVLAAYEVPEDAG